jgi:hypothetical protein
MTTSEFAPTVPPTPAEWAAMADNHPRALRLAYVIANGSASALAGGPAKQMANMATMLGQAAQFSSRVRRALRDGRKAPY